MRRSRLPSTRVQLSRRLIAFDVVCATVAPLLAFWIRDPRLLNQEDILTLAIYCGCSTAVSLTAFVAFRTAHGLPEFFSFHDAIEITKAAALSVAVLSALLFTFTRLDDVPRSVPLIHFFVLSALLIAGRLWRRLRVNERELGSGRKARAAFELNVLLVGVSPLAYFYVRLLDLFAARRQRIVGLIDGNPALVGRTMYGQVVLGTLDDVEALLDDFRAHGTDISEFVICDQRPHIVEIYKSKLRDICEKRIIVLTDLAEELGLDEEVPSTNPVVAGRGLYLARRGMLDAAVAASILVVLAPLLLVISCGVLLAMGRPIFFWQRRLGKDGVPIHVYKFRSMRNPIDRAGRPLTAEQRQSLFGEVLRRTRLDELPQLFNVARGEMALIGPRPLLPDDQPDDASIRLSATPGITGWAQIHGGQLVNVHDKNAMDEFYVRNACPSLDAKIVVATIRTVLFGDRLGPA